MNSMMHIQNLSAQQLEQFAQHGNVLETSTTLGPKVIAMADGEFVKLLRVKKGFSTGLLLNPAKRFLHNAEKLSRLGIPTLQVKALYRVPHLKCWAVRYRGLEGRSLRSIIKKTDLNEDLLNQLVHFIASLHARGIYFRGLHMGNIILTPEGELGLIDILDCYFRPRLFSFQRQRNFKHLFRYEDVRAHQQKILQRYSSATTANHKTVLLHEPFRQAWQGEDVFQRVFAISNTAAPEKIYRNKEGRRTLQFEFASRAYFLKYHSGVGWKEILKNLVQLRLPVLGASNEYRAALKLKALGVDTLTPVAYGCRGTNPAKQESFLITEALTETISLEDFCKNWPIARPSFQIKNALLKKVAATAKTMHENGINHRDFYICHFLLDKKNLLENDFHCYLIDLHRCQLRDVVPVRWIEKDLAGLLYSTMDIGLTARDYFRFIKIYTGKPLRQALQDPIWQKVLHSANKLYQKDFARLPPVIFKQH